MSRRGVLASGAGLSAMTLSGCASTPSLIRHYEFAVTLRVAGRQITRSVVQQFLFRRRRGGIVAPKSVDYGPEGEALAIPLGDHLGVFVSTFRQLLDEPSVVQNFFAGKRLATESWDPLAPLARALLPQGGAGLGRFERWQAVLELPERSEWVQSNPDELPLFVRFADAADPTSAVWVNPEGQGEPAFVSAATRLTDARLTRGPLADALPWLADFDSNGRPFAVAPGPQRRSISELLNQNDLKRSPRR